MRAWMPARVIFQGFCWIEGDNEENSLDSANTHGPVPLALIQGRVSYVMWPPSRIQRVQRSFPQERVLLGYQHPWP
jgi:inner membrane protease subunit 2